jgi:uncharacterized protein DUF3892
MTLNMVTRLEIKWISKSDAQSTHARVAMVSGNYVDGTPWKLAEEDAIRGIESGLLEFFVVADGRTLEVIVAGSRNGRKFLKTEADRERPDYLLKLPDLP